MTNVEENDYTNLKLLWTCNPTKFLEPHNPKIQNTLNFTNL